MRHMHQCARNDANITVRSSGRVPTMLCENHSECRGTALVAIALCHLSGACEPPNIRIGHVAHSRVGQQLLDGHVKKLERKFFLH